MNAADREQLLEAALRRPLTAEELRRRDAHFTAAPDARAAWELELRLRRSLSRLPAVPVATNFTGRVLERIDAVARATERRPVRTWLARWLAHGWLKPALTVLLVAGLSTLTALQIRTRHRATLAHSAAAVSLATRLPDLKLMKDFDPIQRLSAVPTRWVDEELLAALEPGFAR